MHPSGDQPAERGGGHLGPAGRGPRRAHPWRRRGSTGGGGRGRGDRPPSAGLSGLDFQLEGGVPSTPSHSCPAGSAHPGLQLAQLRSPTLAAPGKVLAWEESCDVCAEVPPPRTPSGSPFETGSWQMYHLDGFHRAGGCDGGPHKTGDRTRARGRRTGDIGVRAWRGPCAGRGSTGGRQREAGLGQSPFCTSRDRPRRPVRLRLPASRLGEDGGPLREPLCLSVAVGSSPRTVQAHPVGPTPTPRLLRAWALPGPGEHCHALTKRQQGCRAHGNALLAFSRGSLPPSSPVLNGILDNQSVRPSP